MKNRFFFLIAVLFVFTLLTSGCVQMAMHSKANSDETLDSMKMTITTNSMVYSLFSNMAKTQGYSSVKEMINNPKVVQQATKNSNDQNSFFEPSNMEYSEEWNKDSVIMVFQSKHPFKPIEGSGLTVTREGNYLIYRHIWSPNSDKTVNTAKTTDSSSPFNQMFSASIDYYLEMPGKIVDSNANSVTDNKAEWHMNLDELSNAEFYAKSEIPSFPILLVCGVVLVIIVIGSLGYLLIKKRKTKSSELLPQKKAEVNNPEYQSLDDAISKFEQNNLSNSRSDDNEIRLSEAESWKFQGNDIFKKQNYEDALMCYNKALDILPDYTDALNNKGLVLIKLGRADEARECLAKIKDIQNSKRTE